MSTLHSPYNNGQAAAATGTAGATSLDAAHDPSLGPPAASRDVALAAATVVASGGAPLPTDYSRGYGAMTPVNHAGGQLLPPPGAYHQHSQHHHSQNS
ncbi:hypothetical protein EC988_004560, partial [Linderina pennispora]